MTPTTMKATRRRPEHRTIIRAEAKVLFLEKQMRDLHDYGFTYAQVGAMYGVCGSVTSRVIHTRPRIKTP